MFSTLLLDIFYTFLLGYFSLTNNLFYEGILKPLLMLFFFLLGHFVIIFFYKGILQTCVDNNSLAMTIQQLLKNQLLQYENNIQIYHFKYIK